jgi:hypothetical protein
VRFSQKPKMLTRYLALDTPAWVKRRAKLLPIPNLGLEPDEQEEYSTMLLWLQNQIETGEPSERIVTECIAYFEQFSSRAA